MHEEQSKTATVAPLVATKLAGYSISPDAAEFLDQKISWHPSDEDVEGAQSVLWTQVQRVRKIRLECKDPDESYDIHEIDVRLGYVLYLDLFLRP